MENIQRYTLKKVKKHWVTVAVTLAFTAFISLSSPVLASQVQAAEQTEAPSVNQGTENSAETLASSQTPAEISAVPENQRAPETSATAETDSKEASEKAQTVSDDTNSKSDIPAAVDQNAAETSQKPAETAAGETLITQEELNPETKASSATTAATAETDTQAILTDLASNSHIKEISGQYFYIGEDGQPQKNLALSVGGHTYYFDGHTGVLHDPRQYQFTPTADQATKTGFFKNDQGVTYYAEDGQQVKNRFIDDGDKGTYYFNEAGFMVFGHQTVDSKSYFFLENGIRLENAFLQNADGTWNFFAPGGNRIADDFRLFKTADGQTNWRHFDQEGVMSIGTKEINGLTFHFDETGFMTRSQWVNNVQPSDGTTGKRYFTSEGILATNRFASKSGSRYYLDDQGKPVTGYQTIDGKLYYFNSEGVMVKGFRKHGSGKLRYYSPETGAAISDVYVAHRDGTYYYFDQNGVGRIAEGDLQIKDSSLRGLQTIGSHTYYFDSEGQVVKGQWLTAEDGKTYYFEDGSGIMAINRFITKDNQSYYLGADGQPLTGDQLINGKIYSFSKDGKQRKGFEQLIDSQNARYFDTDTGELVTNRFAIRARIGIFYWTYLGEDGEGLTGDHVLNGVTHHFRPDGREFRNISGRGYSYDIPYMKEDKSAYYFSAAGQTISEKWITDETGATYYYGAGGQPVTGEQVIDGKNYYFSSDGKQVKGRFVRGNGDKFNSYRYYDKTSGEMVSNQFMEHNYYKKAIHWVYLGQDGWTVTGDQTIDGKPMYFYTDGGQARKTIIMRDGKARYFDDDGVQVFNSFVTLDDKAVYYLGADGYAVTGKQTINGKVYEFTDLGKLITEPNT